MYNIPYHKELNEEVIKDFIKEYPFGFLSGCNSNGNPIATQLPLLGKTRNGKLFLFGHFMKGTDHHKAFTENENSLVVFTGKSTYVSGTWYKNKNTPSTWNYMSVHAKGKMDFVSKEVLKDILRETSLYFEGNNQSSPTVFDNLPESFKSRALEMIIGFEIEVTEIDTVFKLSQDRDYDSFENIIKQLKLQDNDAKTIASEMEKRKSQIFPEK